MSLSFWKSIRPHLNSKVASMEKELQQKDLQQYTALKSLEKNKLAMIFTYSLVIAPLLAISFLIARLLKLI